jgi:hypothetical protein
MSSMTWLRHARPQRGAVAVLASLATLAGAPMAAQAADLNATPSNLASVFDGAAGGDTIHLASGDYGQFNGGTKSSMVTLTPQSGATASIYPWLSPGQNIRFDGLRIAGAYVNGSKNIQFVNSTFTNMTRVDTPEAITGAGILFDHDTFDGIDKCDSCNEGRLTVYDPDGHGNAAVGVTISNSHFGNGGQSDGIQLLGPRGVKIINNVFSGIVQQGSYTAHVDPIQLYGGTSETQITGNWFHDNSTAIMAPDGSNSEVITNNVFNLASYPWAMVMGGAVGDTITHNTLVGYGATIEIGKSNGGTASSGNVVKDNVANSVTNESGAAATGVTQDYNLLSSGTRGAHDIRGSPTFAGGSSPSSFAGYALAGGSTGSTNADDGTAIGISASGTTPVDPTPPAPPADTTAPDTTISSGPAAGATITTASASFAFSSSESGSTFTCRLDSGSYGSCTSPKAYSSLANGSHTFSVRATDAAGNTDASPATRTFTVNVAATPPADTTAPDTTIASGPSGTTGDSTPAFAFSASESGSAFACKVDSGSWASCTSPKTLSSLADGAHTFSVRATDAAGNTDASPATRTFTIDTTAPRTTIGAAPSALTIGTTATVSFTSDDAGATFACALDGGAWAACSSPHDVTGLALGSHTLTVRATDAAGNVESPGASATWTALGLPVAGDVLPSDPAPAADPVPTDTPDVPDATGEAPAKSTPPAIPAADLPPAVALASSLAGSTFTRTLKIAATASDDDAVQRVELWVDGTRVATDRSAPYATTWTAPRALGYGVHTVTARAFDASGQAASAAATVTRVHSASAHSSRAAGAQVGSTPAARGTAVSGRAGANRALTVTQTKG